MGETMDVTLRVERREEPMMQPSIVYAATTSRNPPAGCGFCQIT